MPLEQWKGTLVNPPEQLSNEDRNSYLKTMDRVALSSDAFFPFRDNIDHAAVIGVRYIASPSGSTNDQQIIDACNEHGIAMAHTNLRLFHH